MVAVEASRVGARRQAEIGWGSLSVNKHHSLFSAENASLANTILSTCKRICPLTSFHFSIAQASPSIAAAAANFASSRRHVVCAEPRRKCIPISRDSAHLLNPPTSSSKNVQTCLVRPTAITRVRMFVYLQMRCVPPFTQVAMLPSADSEADTALPTRQRSFFTLEKRAFSCSTPNRKKEKKSLSCKKDRRKSTTSSAESHVIN